MITETTCGRQPIQIVEITDKVCSLTYGTSPCAAAVGETGIRKCYNTFKTCQDSDNYAETTRTLRFSTGVSLIYNESYEDVEPKQLVWGTKDLYWGTKEMIWGPYGLELGESRRIWSRDRADYGHMYPSVQGVSTSPTRLNIGASNENYGPLGKRASITVSFKDHPDSDSQTDPYLSDRDYDPIERGTFWAKYNARSPYYPGLSLKIYDGYVGQDLVDMRTRSYIIEKIQGPDSSDTVTITAKDILKQADGKRAQAPVESKCVLNRQLVYNADGEQEEISEVTTVADSGGSLNDTWFRLDSVYSKFAVWYNVNGAGTITSITGRTLIEVAISTNATANTVASETADAIDAVADFGASDASNVVTITNAHDGAVNNVSDGDEATGFAYETTQEGYPETEIELTAKTGLSIEASEFPAPGIVCIGNELIKFSASADGTGEQNGLVILTIDERTYEGTTPETHAADENVQLCYWADSTQCWDVVYDLLVNYAGIDSSLIDTAAWDEEGDYWLADFLVSAIISKPEAVNKLIGEICEQCMMVVWWNERTEKIDMQAIRPPVGAYSKINEDNHIIQDSLSVRSQEDERFNQVWIYTGIRDYLGDIDDNANYSTISITVSTETGYSDTRIKKIYSRWLMSEAQSLTTATRILQRFSTIPTVYMFSMDAKDRDIWTGAVAELTHRTKTDFTGETVGQLIQIISSDEFNSGHSVKYEGQSFPSQGINPGYWQENDAPDYGDATEEQLATGGWWADDDGLLDGDPGYEWQ